MAMFTSPAEAAAAFKAALKVRNPSAQDLETIRAAIDQIVASPGNATFLPDLAHPIQGENLKQQQRNAAYWMQRYAEKRGITLSDDFPEGVSYGKAAAAAKSAAKVKTAGQPVAATPVAAQLEEAAAAAGTPRVPFAGGRTQVTPEIQNIIKQLTFENDPRFAPPSPQYADPYAPGYQAGGPGLGAAESAAESAASRTYIPRTGTFAGRAGAPAFSSLESNLASQLAGLGEDLTASSAAKAGISATPRFTTATNPMPRFGSAFDFGSDLTAGGPTSIIRQFDGPYSVYGTQPAAALPESLAPAARFDTSAFPRVGPSMSLESPSATGSRFGFGPSLSSADEVLAANRAAVTGGAKSTLDDAIAAMLKQSTATETAVNAIGDVSIPAASRFAKFLHPTTGMGNMALGLGYGLAGEAGNRIIRGMGTNEQGEVSDLSRIGGAAAKYAGIGAGLGMAIPIPGVGAGVGALAGGAIGGGLEALFGDSQSHSFEDKKAAALQHIMSAIPAGLDPASRQDLLSYIDINMQFADSPDALKQIVSDAPKLIMSALGTSQSQRQQQARLAAMQSVMAPLLTKLYDTGARETGLNYDRMMKSADVLQGIDPAMAALSRERAALTRQSSYDNALSQASALANPAADQFDLMNNINQQTQSSLVGRLAQQVAEQYLPTQSRQNASLTG